MQDRQAVGHQQWVLVVDDSEDMRTMLGRLVERAGYHALYAGDGQSSLDQAQQHHPDLVLMDLSLPDMDGWEAVRRLRAMEAFRTIPIIAVTAHVSPADQERALAVGCSVHIGKPFKTATLLESIQRLLEGEK